MQEHALIVRIKALLAQEARLDVAMLETLAKVFDERLWQRLGYPTSHDFCTKYLGMSEDTAWRRRKCADLMQRYSALVRPLIAGRKLTQTNLATIHKLVNDENAERLINEIVGKTKREVEAIVAREAPKPDVSSGVRTVQAPLTLTASTLCPSNEAPTPVFCEAPVQPSNAVYEELERKRRAKLKRPKSSSAKAVSGAAAPHQCEEPAVASQNEEAPLSDFPETTGPKTHSRYIDAETRRFVLRRDNYECQFCRRKRTQVL